MTPTVVLAAHGSRDPRAGATVRALARAVATGPPAGDVDAGAPPPGLASWSPRADVRAAFLELTGPHLADVLAGLGRRPAVVVPLLLTPAYHARTDLPGVVAAARDGGARVEVAGVLGPEPGGAVAPELVEALRARLVGASARLVGASARRGRGVDRLRPAVFADGSVFADGLVLAAAGSRDPAALASVAAVAAALEATIGRPCRPGYVTGLGEPVADAVAGLRAGGARSVAVASYFLAPGLLYDRAVEAATESAAVTAVAPPLGAHRDLVALVRRRVREAPVPSAAVAVLAPAA